MGVLEGSLKLLHPFMPFVTEELWQNLPHEGEALIIAPWPTAGEEDTQAIKQFEAVQAVIRAVRNAKVESRVESKRVPAIVLANPDSLALFTEQRESLIRLAGIDAANLEITDNLPTVPAQAMALVTDAATVYLPLSGLLDLDQERARLTKELGEAAKEIENHQTRLSNSSFTERAPAPVVEKVRESLQAALERQAKLQERLAALV